MAEDERVLIVNTESTGPMEILLTGENPETADYLWNSLPAESTVNQWGEEIYFELPMTHGAEDARAEVEVGDVAWWPAGSCLCLFWGRTPVSDGDRPVAASPVNVIGRLKADPAILARVKAGDRVVVARV